MWFRTDVVTTAPIYILKHIFLILQFTSMFDIKFIFDRKGRGWIKKIFFCTIIILRSLIYINFNIYIHFFLYKENHRFKKTVFLPKKKPHIQRQIKVVIFFLVVVKAWLKIKNPKNLNHEGPLRFTIYLRYTDDNFIKN